MLQGKSRKKKRLNRASFLLAVDFLFESFACFECGSIACGKLHSLAGGGVTACACITMLLFKSAETENGNILTGRNCIDDGGENILNNNSRLLLAQCRLFCNSLDQFSSIHFILLLSFMVRLQIIAYLRTFENNKMVKNNKKVLRSADFADFTEKILPAIKETVFYRVRSRISQIKFMFTKDLDYDKFTISV